MRRKWLLCGILCGVVSLSVFGQNVGASNYDKQIKETEKQQKEWENKADSLQKEIEEIQADKDDTLKYIEKLDKKTASLEEELEKLHAQVASSEKKLKVIQKELATVSLMMRNNAVFLSPSVSSCSSSYIVRSRSSWMSKGANLAPQEMRMDFAVLPAASL